MSKRSTVNKRADQAYFRNTASKIKKQNLPGNALRGGIRL